MKWFKHENTFNNPKIEVLKETHGSLGYGVYFQVIEMIASNVEKDNEKDWGYIPEEYTPLYLSKKLHISLEEYKIIIDECLRLKLLEDRKGRLFCGKIIERCDDYTSQLLRQTSKKLPRHLEETSSRRRIEEEREEKEKKNINTGENRPEEKSSLENKKTFSKMFSIPLASKGISTSFQEKAFRYAKELNITLPEEMKGRWIKIFKRAELGEKRSNIDLAYGYLSDYPKPLTDTEKIMFFFKIYENGLSNIEPKKI